MTDASPSALPGNDVERVVFTAWWVNGSISAVIDLLLRFALPPVPVAVGTALWMAPAIGFTVYGLSAKHRRFMGFFCAAYFVFSTIRYRWPDLWLFY